MKLLLVLLTLCSLLSLPVLAAIQTKGGVKFKDTITWKKKKLVLNGLGIREATIFNVDVYVAGLYLKKKSKSAKKIISSKSDKILILKFVRDVSADQMRGAWNESFGKRFAKQVQRLNKAMVDVKKNDRFVFKFQASKASLSINRKTVARFKNPSFARHLLAVWLGPKPPNKGLKTGLLGLQ